MKKININKMESNVNESFEYNEKEDISWSQVKEKIPKLLILIKEILIKKIEDEENHINTLYFFEVKDDLGINAEEPYIMNE